MNKDIDIGNEELLILALCRMSFSGVQKLKIIDLIGSVTDWNYFGHLANEHGIAALAGKNLELLEVTDMIPADILSRLINARLISLGRNTFLAEVMAEVLELLNANTIRTVLLKGLALELTEYGNSGLRQMSDADILVEHKNCLEAREILSVNGFKSLPLKSPLHKPLLGYIGKHLPSLIKNGASVEIHFDLFGERNKELTQLFIKESTRISLNNQPAYIPSPQLFFLYLIKHLHAHEMNNESQLRLYTDLFILLEKHSNEIIDYNLLELVSKANLSDAFTRKLLILRDFWGLAFPDWLNEFIEKRDNRDSVKRFLFFIKNPKKNPPLNKAAVYSQIIKDIPGIHRKLLFILGDIFPSFSFMKKRYKSNSSIKVLIHYPARIGKLWWIVKGGRREK